MLDYRIRVPHDGLAARDLAAQHARYRALLETELGDNPNNRRAAMYLRAMNSHGSSLIMRCLGCGLTEPEAHEVGVEELHERIKAGKVLATRQHRCPDGEIATMVVDHIETLATPSRTASRKRSAGTWPARSGDRGACTGGEDRSNGRTLTLTNWKPVREMTARE